MDERHLPDDGRLRHVLQLSTERRPEPLRCSQATPTRRCPYCLVVVVRGSPEDARHLLRACQVPG